MTSNLIEEDGLIIATGSNLGSSLDNLQLAQDKLQTLLGPCIASRVYRSAAVDYENQPDFLNQVLQFPIPQCSPQEVMRHLLQIEQEMGRSRTVWRGPRTIDLDLLFWGQLAVHETDLIVPHPRWLERSFVVRPLSELPFFKSVQKCFTIPTSFEVEAFPLN